MKPDTRVAGDDVARAHLKEPGDDTHTMHRYDPPSELAGLVRRFWIPVWSVPAGRESRQRVLQYPVCLLVVTGAYARFYGVASGLSTTTLSGQGWAAGVMCAPAAGQLIAGGTVADYTDRYVDLSQVLGEDGTTLIEQVRAAMEPDPTSSRAHARAIAAYCDTLRRFVPIDAEGELVNRIVHYVETANEVTRVAQLCEAFGLSERALQRLVRHRLGLTPKWLIQRRRLHEAADRLRDGTTAMTQLAVELGYADQAHFIRDFSRVTEMTPGQFATRYRE